MNKSKVSINSSDPKWLLECRDITKTYQEGSLQTQVLKGVSFSLKTREMLAIIGSSGSGKSTLLHLLGTLDSPTSGQIIFNAQDIYRLSNKQQGILRNKDLGFIYQFHHLMAEFSALENVAMPLLIKGVKVKEAQQRSATLLEKVGLTHRLNHRPSELSGGERQRVAIARALVNKPKLVLADEPTGNLDHKSAENIYGLLCELNEQLETAFVVVTHDLQLAQRLDRQLQMADGVLLNKAVSLGVHSQNSGSH